jgi:CHASE3 domain sensor protein
MKVQLSLLHKGIVLVVVTLVFELAFLAILTFLLNQASSIAYKQASAKEAISKANDLYTHSYAAASALLTYSLLKKKSYGEEYENELSQIADSIHALKVKTADNSHLSEQVSQLDMLMNQFTGLLDPIKHNIDQGGYSLTGFMEGDWVKQLRMTLAEVNAELHEFSRLEERVELANPAAVGKRSTIAGLT